MEKGHSDPKRFAKFGKEIQTVCIKKEEKRPFKLGSDRLYRYVGGKRNGGGGGGGGGGLIQ